MLLLVKFILFDKKIYYYHSERAGARHRCGDWARAGLFNFYDLSDCIWGN